MASAIDFPQSSVPPPGVDPFHPSPGCVTFGYIRCKGLLDNRLSQGANWVGSEHERDGGTISVILTKPEPILFVLSGGMCGRVAQSSLMSWMVKRRSGPRSAVEKSGKRQALRVPRGAGRKFLCGQSASGGDRSAVTGPTGPSPE